ncbi:hypothetical protein BJ508DRAFT_314980 [Ascobolus immersus RN42]|uniref:Uncharacterized protein n=1 Tax=Ascobolus immersus RN42 TaxID=1160509 RepID=A0A3N4HJM3_ASCIM|nr:hypothetical protein BJ508DRAFT_314980 [Ascobolus immersus RN42]
MPSSSRTPTRLASSLQQNQSPLPLRRSLRLASLSAKRTSKIPSSQRLSFSPRYSRSKVAKRLRKVGATSPAPRTTCPYNTMFADVLLKAVAGPEIYATRADLSSPLACSTPPRANYERSPTPPSLPSSPPLRPFSPKVTNVKKYNLRKRGVPGSTSRPRSELRPASKSAPSSGNHKNKPPPSHGALRSGVRKSRSGPQKKKVRWAEVSSVLDLPGSPVITSVADTVSDKSLPQSPEKGPYPSVDSRCQGPSLQELALAHLLQQKDEEYGTLVGGTLEMDQTCVPFALEEPVSLKERFMEPEDRWDCDRIPTREDPQFPPYCDVNNPTEFYHWVREAKIQKNTVDGPHIKFVLHERQTLNEVFLTNLPRPEQDPVTQPLKTYPLYRDWESATRCTLEGRNPQNSIPSERVWVQRKQKWRGLRIPHTEDLEERETLRGQGVPENEFPPARRFVRRYRNPEIVDETCSLSGYESNDREDIMFHLNPRTFLTPEEEIAAYHAEMDD